MPPSISIRKGHLPVEEATSDWLWSAMAVDPRIPVVHGGE
jgi:hypothetical protein